MNTNPDLNTENSDFSELFTFFNEVGIINQLAVAILAKSLPDGLHPSHFAIINHLSRMGDGKTPIRIANAMQVTKTTMTHSLKVLRDRKLIVERPNPDDARGKLVFLTPAGRAFRVDAMNGLEKDMRPLVSEDLFQRLRSMTPNLAHVREFLDKNRL